MSERSDEVAALLQLATVPLLQPEAHHRLDRLADEPASAR